MKRKDMKIKIFVSQRTDGNSYKIKSRIFQNIYCGGYEKNHFEEGLIGDNTGENISKKKKYLSELTVQYWVWKNIKLDYYGFCHYRRFISFSNEQDKDTKNEFEFIVDKQLNDESIVKYSLCEEKTILNDIEKYDIICCQKIDIRKVRNVKGESVSIRHHWDSNSYRFKSLDIFNHIIETIKEAYDEKISKLFEIYIDGYEYNGFNCYIMKRDLFYKQCDFTFNILNIIKKYIPINDNNSANQNRLEGFIGEILNGFVIWYYENYKQVKIKRRNVVFFENTEKNRKHLLKGSIPIVLMSSDYYIPYTSVCIESIVKNSNKKKKYTIIVFTKNISYQNKNKLSDMLKKHKNIELIFIDPSHLFGKHKLFVASENYEEEAYYRILTPYILKNVNKAIVMDADIIVNDDISKLYEINIGNSCIGAVVDYVYQGFLNYNMCDELEYTLKKMKMKNPYNYVNTGVMIMNLKKIREKFSLEYIINEATKKKYRIQEQDVINVLFEGDIHFVDVIWNYYLEVNDSITDYINKFTPTSSRENYYKKRKKAKILHWASQPKPWNDMSVIDSDIFWDYAKHSPFLGIIKQRYQENVVKNVNKGFNEENNCVILKTPKWLIKKMIMPPTIKAVYKNNEIELEWEPIKWANGYMLWKKIDNVWQPIISFNGLKIVDPCVFSTPVNEYGIRSYYKSDDNNVIWSELKTIVIKCPEY